MLVHVSTEYRDVIQVYCNEFSNIVYEDLIHQLLERGRYIEQPKRHDEKFKMALVRTKAIFWIDVSSIVVWWYPDARSSFVNMVAWPSISNSESMRGNGN